MVLEYNFKRIIKIAINGEEEEAKKMVIPGSLPFRAPNPDVSLDNTYTRRDQDWELYNTVDKTMRLHNLKDSIEVDRFAVMRKEKEMSLKTESVDDLKNSTDNTDSTIEDLEHKLQQYINENNELEIKIEEAIQDSERKDIKAEFEVMSSALSKEIGMMTSQLNPWKKT